MLDIEFGKTESNCRTPRSQKPGPRRMTSRLELLGLVQSQRHLLLISARNCKIMRPQPSIDSKHRDSAVVQPGFPVVISAETAGNTAAGIRTPVVDLETCSGEKGEKIKASTPPTTGDTAACRARRVGLLNFLRGNRKRKFCFVVLALPVVVSSASSLLPSLVFSDVTAWDLDEAQLLGLVHANQIAGASSFNLPS